MDDEPGIATDLRVGGLVDERYRILQIMAAGSMGTVYKAERVPVGKLVAIKFLHAPFANDGEFLGRFERETRVMSRLAHPNCVSVLDFGVWEGAPYLVMDYVSGTTLRTVIDHGALPPRRALALVRQIAAGLAHAHAQGIVHRDVKPANIMISDEIGTGDHVRILDFGLARLRGAVGRDATQSNVVVGTPNYMAPEQTVGGGLIDARTDIYAVGVVLFEMVCGDRPFQADDTLALLGMHRAAPIPRLADRAPGGVVLPRGLQDVIDQAMAKSPADRFQSAIELAEAIDAVAARASSASGAEGRDGELRDGRDLKSGRLVIRRGVDAKKVTGTAPTMLDISDEVDLAPQRPPSRPPAKPRGSFFGSLIALTILLGGIAAAVLWVKTRSADTKAVPRVETGSTTTADVPGTHVDTGGAGSGSDLRGSAVGSAASSGQDLPSGGSAAGSDQPASGSAAAAAVLAGAGSADGSAGSAAQIDAPAAGSAAEGAAARPGSADGSAGSAAHPDGAATGAGSATTDPAASGAGSAEAAGSAAHVDPAGQGSAARPTETRSGSGASRGAAKPADPDIEMDPATAEDPAPASARRPANDDEAANAPKTAEEVEKVAKRVPAAAAPALATSVSGAVQLIKDGKRDLALASLRALGKKNPSSAYIPFLLGNLYFEQQWWSVAMDHYGAAIKKNPQYRSNPTLNRNVIRMLASTRTSRRAEGFLKFNVGKPALPYVKYAAQRDSNSQVRRLSGWLAKNI